MYKQILIDGILTYLFHPEELDELLKDSNKPEDFLNCILWHKKRIQEITHIEEVKLYPAVCHVEKINCWMPVYCMEQGESYYHVGFNQHWRCRDCGTENGPVLLHQTEVYRDVYIGREWPQIPPIFRKICCKKCGHMLQGHLIKLKEI